MNLLSWLDDRTVIACQGLLAAIYTVVLLGVRRLYPRLRGAGAMALGFFFALATILVVIAGTHLPANLVLVASTGLGFLCYVSFYWAILRFCRAEAAALEQDAAGVLARRVARGHMVLLAAVAAISLAVLGLSVRFAYPLAVRIAVVILPLLVARTLMTIVLLRCASGRLSMRLFALTQVVLALLTLYNGILIVLATSPAGALRYHALQKVTLVAGILSLCTGGVCFLAMLAGTIAGDIKKQTAIAAQLEAREQILRGEERLRFMAEAMPQKVFTTLPDGSADYHNQEWAKFTGLSVDQLQGWNWSQLVHPEDLAESVERWKHSVENCVPFEIEQRFRSQDGDYRWHLSRAHPMRSPEGELLMWIGSSTDIQDQKLAEAALRKSEKLAVAGRLAASISHEINNPLESVMNLLYLIKTQEQSEPISAYARAAEEELARVAHIVTHTLQFHRQPTAATRERLSTLLEATIGLYSGRLAGSSIELKTRFADAQPILCFPAELRQVFANLLGNAFDATRSGGRIHLRSREAFEPKTGRRGVQVTIADSGCGMDDHTRKHLFEPFFTTKGNNGTGLGLWISAEILERHQSSVRVRSSQRPGCSGTVFTMFFPHEASVAPAAASQMEPVASKVLEMV